MPRLACLLLLMYILMTTGCSVARKTTTDRTAVEMALLSSAAERVMNKYEDPAALAGMSFFLDISELKAVDSEYVISALRLDLLKAGLNEAASRDDADLVVRPRTAVHGIDDSEVLLGIPAVPIVIPGAGSVETPELALFKRIYQRATSKFGAYAQRRDDGSLAFNWGEEWGRAFYTRWTILVFINFRTTDLPAPWSDEEDRPD